MIRIAKSQHTWMILGAMCVCGTISILFGKEVHFDLANYHYYNPFAYFNQRWDFDYWPPTNQPIYLNPVIDFFGYFLIQHFPPIAVEFILGSIHGLNVWLLFVLSLLIIRPHFPHTGSAIALAIACVGMYGPISFIEIGSFMGDNLISLFVLLSLILELHYINVQATRFLFLSGLILGLAIGLKLTAGMYVLGWFMASMFMPMSAKKKFVMLILFGLAIGLGIIISAGHWMWFLWEHFGSPTFPYFNQIFKAPDFPFENWRDTRFLPHSFWQALFFPFFFSWNQQTSEFFFTDFRFPILYVLILFALPQLKKLNNSSRWLVIFFVTSYIAWQIYFSYMRYLCCLQIIAPLIIFILIHASVKNIWSQFLMLASCFLIIILTMQVGGEARVKKFGDDYFNVHLPVYAKAPLGTVLVAYPQLLLSDLPLPQGYLIPFFPKGWRFIGVPFKDNNYLLSTKIRDKLKITHGDVYLLSSSETLPALYKAALELGFIPNGACQKITTDRDPYGVPLCPMKRNR